MKWEKDFQNKCETAKEKEIQDLPELLSKTTSFLSSLPKGFSEEYLETEAYEQLLREDYRTGLIAYWQEIDERINFLWYTTGQKALSLLQNIIFCINSKNYFPALILTRALLENVAVFFYCSSKISIAYDNVIRSDLIGKIFRKEIKGMVVSKELEDLLIKYSHGTTLKELIKIQKKWKQTRISEHIKFLSKDKNYEKAYDYYSYLCQVAHPNFGSTWVFYYGGEVSNKKEIHYFGIKQNLDFFLVIASYPLMISCKILRDGIPKLKKVKFM